MAKIYSNYLGSGFGESGAKEIILGEIDDESLYVAQRKLLQQYKGKTGAQYNCIMSYKILKDERESSSEELISFLVFDGEANRDEQLNRCLNLLPYRPIKVDNLQALLQSGRAIVSRNMENIVQAKRDSIQSRIEEYQGDIFESGIAKLLKELERLDDEMGKQIRKRDSMRSRKKFDQAEVIQKIIEKIKKQRQENNNLLEYLMDATGGRIKETRPSILDISWHVDSFCVIRIS